MDSKKKSERRICSARRQKRRGANAEVWFGSFVKMEVSLAGEVARKASTTARTPAIGRGGILRADLRGTAHAHSRPRPSQRTSRSRSRKGERSPACESDAAVRVAVASPFDGQDAESIGKRESLAAPDPGARGFSSLETTCSKRKSIPRSASSVHYGSVYSELRKLFRQALTSPQDSSVPKARVGRTDDGTENLSASATDISKAGMYPKGRRI